MKKVLINVTERQHKALKKDAESIGIPMAEYIRRVFDSYLDEKSYREPESEEKRDPEQSTAANNPQQ